MVRRQVDALNEAVEQNDQEDEINEVVVMVRGAEKKKITTIMKLVSPMIDGASSIYERLYELKEEEKIKIVFRFISSVDVDQGEGNDTGKYLEDEISVVCQHQHPYLDKQVWLDTKGVMEMTYLKGKHALLMHGVF
jgi:hypothetical protein